MDNALVEVVARSLARAVVGRLLASRKETALHKVADVHLQAMKSAVLKAFREGQLAIKDVPPRLAPDIAATAVHDALLETLPKTLRKILNEAGEHTANTLPQRRAASVRAADATFRFRFDVNDQRAIEWAKDHAAELAKGISDTTRDDIASAVAEALETGEDPREAIADAVGDDARADLIARTEIMSAANEGQRQAWDQAVDEGLLSETAQRVWIATEDACPECDALDGETAPLDDDYPGEGGDGPPLHPNCRCTEGIIAA